MKLDLFAVAEPDLVDDGRRGGDEVEVELTRQPFLHDLQMQEAEETAAKAEAERRRRLGLIGKRRVVEPQLADRGAQILEVGGVDREETAKDDRLRRTKTRERHHSRTSVLSDGVTDASVGHFLDRAGEEAEFAGFELRPVDELGSEHTDSVDLMRGAGAHHADLHALLEHAVDDAHEHDHAEIGVVPAVDQQRFQRRAGIAHRRRQAVDDRLKHVADALAGLGGNENRARRVEPDHIFDLLTHAFRLSRRQIDLVEDGHDLVVVVERLINVGERLRLDTLAGVDHEQRAFAGGERAAHLIGEIDMAGRVDEVEHIVLGRRAPGS